MTSFKRNIAIIIGINQYENGITPLQTAVNDAVAIGEVLEKHHNYQVELLLDQEAILCNLNNLFKGLHHKIERDDRLLVYFAGHGVALDGEDGPEGYLVPQDAKPGDKGWSLLPMQRMHDWLVALDCRHCLTILDCCFAGAFRWSSFRDIAVGGTSEVYEEQYQRYIHNDAWQIISSAGFDEKALDVLSLEDQRGEGDHSPFAQFLMDALEGAADIYPPSENGKPAGDGIIVANELILHIDGKLNQMLEGQSHRQSPRLWPFRKHGKGEFVFETPGRPLSLKKAAELMPLDEETNPYRGLQSYEEEHSELFFGRTALVRKLYKHICIPISQLTVVLGASGSGKSSLVKAGLTPKLKRVSNSFEQELLIAYVQTTAILGGYPQLSLRFWPLNSVQQWYVLQPMRPGETPLQSLAKVILPITDQVSVKSNIFNVVDELINQKSESARQLRQDWESAKPAKKLGMVIDHYSFLTQLGGTEHRLRLKELKNIALSYIENLARKLSNDASYLSKIAEDWEKESHDQNLLLIIDQAEELITLCKDEDERKKLLEQLAFTLMNKETHLQVLLTLRSDFEPQLQSSILKPFWENARFFVPLMNRAELREAIEEPAARKVIFFELEDQKQSLVEKLIDEVIDMPGALPLLSFTLSELYSKYLQRQVTARNQGLKIERSFTFSDYKVIGGVQSSVTSRADELYKKLVKEVKISENTVRDVMLRMVTVGKGDLARRRVPISELKYLGSKNEQVEKLLQEFVDVRLIIQGQDDLGRIYVEPAHDALVRGWEKLLTWQREEKGTLVLQRRLTFAAEEWEAINQKYRKQPKTLIDRAYPVLDIFDRLFLPLENFVTSFPTKLVKLFILSLVQLEHDRQKPKQFLWDGNPYLELLNREFNSKDNWLNRTERKFVQESIFQKRRKHSWRWRIVVGVILLLTGMTIFAEQRRQLAEKRTADALIQQAKNLVNTQNPFSALTTIVEAGLIVKYANWKDSAQKDQLMSVFWQTAQKTREFNYLEEISFFSFSPDGKNILLIKNNGELLLWRTDNYLFSNFHLHNVEVLDAKFSPDGQVIASVSKDGTVQLWQKDSTLISTLEDHKKVARLVRFSPDGQRIAAGNKDGTISLWRRDGTFITTFIGHPEGSSNSIDNLEFSPDGKTIVSSVSEQSINLWKLDGTLIKSFRERRKIVTLPNHFAFSPDGQLIAIVSQDFLTSKLLILKLDSLQVHAIQEISLGVLDLEFSPDGKLIALAGIENIKLYKLDGTLIQNIGVLEEGESSFQSVQFSSDGQLIASSNSDSQVKLWERDGTLIYTLEGHKEGVQRVRFSPDNQIIASLGFDGSLKIWKTYQTPLSFLRNYDDFGEFLRISPTGETLASVGESGDVKLRNFDGNLIQVFQINPDNKEALKFTPDGKKL